LDGFGTIHAAIAWQMSKAFATFFSTENL
jgi:hypothetical protein